MRSAPGPTSTRFLVWLLAVLVLMAGAGGAWAVAGGLRAAPATRTAPLRVMPLGDSITLGPEQGGGISGGYRTDLWQQLVQQQHLAVDFVGSQRSGAPELQHEGHGGWRIDGIRGIVDDALATYTPDVVLLHVGTNDVGQRYALDAAPGRLRDLTVRICADRPGVDLVVASIIPIGSLEPLVESYNAAIPGIVAGLQESGCHARFVDMYDVVKSTQLFDGVHPDPAGYAAMAGVWAPQITAAYSAAALTGSPHTMDDDVFGYRGAWLHDTDRPKAFWSGEHHSGNTGDTATVTFNGSLTSHGSTVVLYGATGPAGGIAAVTVDGDPETLIDYYSPDPREQVPVYRSPPLTGQTHTLTVRVTGTNNPASTDAVVSVDRIAMEGS